MKHPSFPHQGPRLRSASADRQTVGRVTRAWQGPHLRAEIAGTKRHTNERLWTNKVSEMIYPETSDQEPALVGSGPSTDERLLMTAGVTHELRTPLTILKGRLHGIEDGVIEPGIDETARLLRQVEHLLEIVNDLDALALADLGRLSLNRREVNLAEIVAAVVSDLRPLLARHDMEILETYEDVYLQADPVRVTQIVTNLLTNASKHSPAGGRIIVQVGASGQTAWLIITDEGPGFAPEDQERLFTPFWRSSATIKRAGCPGTGMGLALTARLVAAHGGDISAQNREDRSGACFHVALPMR